MNDLPPIQHPRPQAERPSIDWDKPVGNGAGYAHATTLSLLPRGVF
ncbi:MAG: hypothetical protein U1C73_14745 [Dietzia sp.]|nr:hypothetical protein [Dietzia sp.]